MCSVRVFTQSQLYKFRFYLSRIQGFANKREKNFTLLQKKKVKPSCMNKFWKGDLQVSFNPKGQCIEHTVLFQGIRMEELAHKLFIFQKVYRLCLPLFVLVLNIVHNRKSNLFFNQSSMTIIQNLITYISGDIL